jgi:c-di-GMP-binding flagellar brake protein YcgR
MRRSDAFGMLLPSSSNTYVSVPMLNAIVANLITSPAAEPALPAHAERRRALRVDLPFAAIVRGMDATNDRFTEHATLDNLSACGLYLRLRRPVEPGGNLFLVVRLAITDEQAPAARIALRGTVVRSESLMDGRCGVAIAFDQHRFLYAHV